MGISSGSGGRRWMESCGQVQEKEVVVVATYKFFLSLEGFFFLFSRFSADNWAVKMHGKGVGGLNLRCLRVRGCDGKTGICQQIWYCIYKAIIFLRGFPRTWKTKIAGSCLGRGGI